MLHESNDNHMDVLKKIITIEDLREALVLKDSTTVEDYEKQFDTIADALFNNFAIKNGYIYYRFLELEFYHNATDEKKGVTIKRETNAGDWFIHDSGVDLAFKSTKQLYGGILTRAMKSGKEYQLGGEYVYGPRNCLWWMFDKISAFGENGFCPVIEQCPSDVEVSYEKRTRWNIDDTRLYRYIAQPSLWVPDSSYNAYPFKK